MHWLIYILIFLTLFFILFFISNVKVKLVFKKADKNDYFELDVWLLYKLIHIQKKVPLIVFESLNEGIKYKSKSNVKMDEQTEKKDRITSEKVNRWHESFKHLLSQIRDFNEVIKNFMKNIYIDQIKWKSRVGTGDAMLTGVLAGSIWGVKGGILGIISKYMKISKKPVINVEPVFQEIVLQSHFECILRFRVGHLILTGIRLLFKLLKGGGKKWRENNIPFKV